MYIAKCVVCTAIIVITHPGSFKFVRVFGSFGTGD
jgi:hypothetical protein